jgi:hypothetical protein
MSPQELLERVHELFDEFFRRMEEVLATFNDIVDKVARFFGWAAEKAVELWNTFVVPLWQKVVDWWNDHANAFGAPWSMYGSATTWRNDVGGQVSRWAGTVTQDTSKVNELWKGTASDGYVARAGEQVTAFKAVAPIAEKVAGALDNVGTAICVWWASIVAAVIGAIAGIAVAAASVATGPGAAVGIPVGVKAAIAIFIGALIVGTTALLGTAAVQKGSLTGALTDLSAFPGGRWPTFG